MTQEQNETEAILELVEQRLRRLLAKWKNVYESDAFQRTAAGVRYGDWQGIVEKLCEEKFCERMRTGELKGKPCGAYRLVFTGNAAPRS